MLLNLAKKFHQASLKLAGVSVPEKQIVDKIFIWAERYYNYLCYIKLTEMVNNQETTKGGRKYLTAFIGNLKQNMENEDVLKFEFDANGTTYVMNCHLHETKESKQNSATISNKANSQIINLCLDMPKQTESILRNRLTYELIIANLKSVIEHELIHLEQILYIGTLPPNKTRNRFPEYVSPNDDHEKYLLNDEEFYPFLVEKIKLFHDIEKYFPAKLHQNLYRYMVDDYSDLPNELKKVKDEMKWNTVNESVLHSGVELIIEDELETCRNFFHVLKEQNFPKYQKAVKEFYKVIN